MSIKTMGWKNPSPLYFNNSSELAQNRKFWSPSTTLPQLPGA